jgi:hypothetical protein
VTKRQEASKEAKLRSSRDKKDCGGEQLRDADSVEEKTNSWRGKKRKEIGEKWIARRGVLYRSIELSSSPSGMNKQWNLRNEKDVHLPEKKSLECGNQYCLLQLCVSKDVKEECATAEKAEKSVDEGLTLWVFHFHEVYILARLLNGPRLPQEEEPLELLDRLGNISQSEMHTGSFSWRLRVP